MTAPVRVVALPDETATRHLAEALAASAPAPAVVHLVGDLGAGKSTLARGWLRALGVAGTVRSPTYTLIERYPLAGGEALHLDLYRIGDVGELEYLGLDDVDACLWLVEWPERGGDALPAADLQITLVHEGAGRSAHVSPESAVGIAWLARLESMHQL
ncbi:tRNA (adenosine(37)-N6)-threonylcarbamoyltransferase complex ATPase subunit type 1 TsaE [Luteimonas deserti]|uniref:tRNA threonylcarbamoyladenosine biosynthesis protein TsaE n=1 Tax=Luteimonas deserti TaxID=2752306 RepID=A0A7Z0QU05_9GAMM|nr:tRNA (adenosine(37)-N6)-threonylcarbamoyltransferase complex ATPase subunit type 1 TsaE [Luteimonas deserti]NYZ63812.1 tRNA (adenosine(37)-N6)-threonylcarbamoyltransferase complex ATPase subunit type 1 TsaE [Luteimonas deserti]